MDARKFAIVKYGSLVLTIALLIWQGLDVYAEFTVFPLLMGERRTYLIATIAGSVLLYIVTNHKEMIFQHILSAINLLLSLYNWIVIGLAYKVAPAYIRTVANDATIFAETEVGAIHSMKVLLVILLVIMLAAIMWYTMVVYHNKVEQED